MDTADREWVVTGVDEDSLILRPVDGLPVTEADANFVTFALHHGVPMAAQAEAAQTPQGAVGPAVRELRT